MRYYFSAGKADMFDSMTSNNLELFHYQREKILKKFLVKRSSGPDSFVDFFRLLNVFMKNFYQMAAEIMVQNANITFLISSQRLNIKVG